MVGTTHRMQTLAREACDFEPPCRGGKLHCCAMVDDAVKCMYCKLLILHTHVVCVVWQAHLAALVVGCYVSARAFLCAAELCPASQGPAGALLSPGCAAEPALILSLTCWAQTVSRTNLLLATGSFGGFHMLGARQSAAAMLAMIRFKASFTPELPGPPGLMHMPMSTSAQTFKRRPARTGCYT